MDRTQLRCTLVSLCIHMLLVLVLFVGPAFVRSKPPTLPEDMPILEFVPLKTVDALISGGGNPNAKPPPARVIPKEVTQSPPPPEPKKEEAKPEPKRMPDPKPDPEPVKRSRPPEPDPDAVEPAPKKKLPDVSTDVVTRKNPKADEAKRKERERERARKQAAEEQARLEREAYEARQRLADRIASAANGLNENLSSSTKVELLGPGGGGVPYANFLQAVKSRYAKAWIVPDGVTDNNATTTASVTIARDGTVVNARVTRPSGNGEVDRSVEDTLHRVKFAAPLPDEAKEDQRTVSINFNVRARRAMG